MKWSESAKAGSVDRMEENHANTDGDEGPMLLETHQVTVVDMFRTSIASLI